MSENEYNEGILIPYRVTEDSESVAQEILKERGVEFDPECVSYLDQLEGEYEEFFIHNKVIYEVKIIKTSNDMDIYKAFQIEDGSISFIVSFYNGSCCLSEALEYAVKKLKKGVTRDF